MTRKKLANAIGNLVNAELTYQEAAICYNLCMLSSVYFGCGITSLTAKEEIELRKLCEEPMLRKFGLSSNFPRDVMHVSKEMLGLGLFLPSTMTATQGLRLHLGNKRIKSCAARIVRALEE